MAFKTPETGIENNEQIDPSAALSNAVDYNKAAETRAGEPANPQATALMEQHASMFGHDQRFGNVTNSEFKTIDGRTMAIDTTNLRNARALKEAASIQKNIDEEAADLTTDAEAMVSNNSAEIPPGNPEASDVAELDAGYEQEASVASAEIASINGGVAERMDYALAQAG